MWQKGEVCVNKVDKIFNKYLTFHFTQKCKFGSYIDVTTNDNKLVQSHLTISICK